MRRNFSGWDVKQCSEGRTQSNEAAEDGAGDLSKEVRPPGLTAGVRLSGLPTSRSPRALNKFKVGSHDQASLSSSRFSLPSQTYGISASFCGHFLSSPFCHTAPHRNAPPLLLLLKLHPDPPAQQPAHAKHVLCRPQRAAPEGVFAHAMNARTVIHRHLCDAKT